MDEKVADIELDIDYFCSLVWAFFYCSFSPAGSEGRK
jgi:hypothetical protein